LKFETLERFPNRTAAAVTLPQLHWPVWFSRYLPRLIILDGTGRVMPMLLSGR